MKKVKVIVLLMLVTAFFSISQVTAQTTTPIPEHQKLGAFIGNWTYEGEAFESPLGPAEKFSGKETGEWFSGKFAVVWREDFKGSISGENHTLNVVTYDITAKTYTWYQVDNHGGSSFTKSSITRDVMITLLEEKVKGKTFKIKCTMKGLGTDKYTYSVEYSEDGKVWKESYRSTGIRVK